MARRAIPTLLALVLLSAALLWLAPRERHACEPLRLVDDHDALEALLASREASGSNVTGRGPFRLEPIDEAVARGLFSMDLPALVFHPACYYRYRPGLDHQVPWPEHPEGSWRRVTNGIGLRRDDDRNFADADLRILVAGDSHTDGVCNNSESFVALLEGLAAARSPGRRVVALNTGVSGYSFYNYLGVLEEALGGAHGAPPDVFVVAAYGGNDFVGTLRPHHYFRGTRNPPRRMHYWERIQAAARISTPALGQGLNQTAYFAENPEQIEVALEATRVLLSRMQERCLEHGVRMVVLHIPAAFHNPWPELEGQLGRALAALELERSDLELALELEQAMAEHLADLGVEYVDLTDPFRAAAEPCYWRRDLHINLHGQRLVAEILDEILSRTPTSLEGSVPAPDADADGPYERRDPDGTLRIRGNYRDGLRSGLWTSFHPDGSRRMRGTYVAGERDGPWEWWYPGNRPQKEGHYQAGKAVGLWTEWYRGGGVRLTGEWQDGLAHGMWREWHPTGSPASEGLYLEGRHEGEWWSWYPSGRPQMMTTFEADWPNGPSESWYEEGGLQARGEYRGGKRQGPWTFWWPNGALRSQGAWNEGAREGEQRFYDEQGRLDPETSGVYSAGRRSAPLE